MSMSKEIITLQVGHYANFVGTHWWNLQDSTFSYDPNGASHPLEINHDVLYREGQTHQGEVTYTPRLISLDLKGSLGSLSACGTLYSAPNPKASIPWKGAVDVHKSEPTAKNEYLLDLEKLENAESEREVCAGTSRVERETNYRLEDSVKVWSDFLRPNLHPRSIYTINEYLHESTTDPFDLFSLGSSCWKKGDIREEVENRIRNYAEECDLLQGFFLMMDAVNGFSGLGSSIAHYLNEEYSTKTVFGLPLVPVFSADKYLPLRLVNVGLTFDSLATSTSLFSPLSLLAGWDLRPRTIPHVNYKANLPYHTSAVLATALETATLPLRKRTGISMTMQDLQHSLVNGSRNAVAITSAIPYPYLSNTLQRRLESIESDLIPLNPGLANLGEPWTQSLVWRGFESKSTFQDSVDLMARLRWEGSITVNTVFQNSCPALAPYPQYFTSDIGAGGYLESGPTQTNVRRFPTAGGIHSTPQMGKAIGLLSDKLNRINVKKMHQFTDTGLEEDDIKESFENLREFVQLYDH